MVEEAGCQGDAALTHPRSSVTINVTESGCTVSSRGEVCLVYANAKWQVQTSIAGQITLPMWTFFGPGGGGRVAEVRGFLHAYTL